MLSKQVTLMLIMIERVALSFKTNISGVIEENGLKFTLRAIILANITRLLIASKLYLSKVKIKSFIEFKKIFRENLIDVKKDINRRSLSWRDQGGYIRKESYSRL